MSNSRKAVTALLSRVSPGLSKREPPPPDEEELPAEKRLWQRFGMGISIINETLCAISERYMDDCSSAYEKAVRAHELERAEQSKAALILSMNKLRLKEPIPTDED